MSTDVRGWHVALVADALLNPSDGALPDVLPTLEQAGYGVLQLPPPGEHPLLLAVTADQVAEYAHHGYAVVAIGVEGLPESGLHWRRLVPLLRHRDALPPPRHVLQAKADAEAECTRLRVFLDGYDLPLEERRRWRV